MIKTKFNIGDIVYLKTDNDQNERLVTGFHIRQNSTSYILTCGTEESYHYDFEISKNIDVIKMTTN